MKKSRETKRLKKKRKGKESKRGKEDEMKIELKERRESDINEGRKKESSLKRRRSKING